MREEEKQAEREKEGCSEQMSKQGREYCIKSNEIRVKCEQAGR